MTQSPNTNKTRRAPFTGRLKTIANRNRRKMFFDVSVIPASVLSYSLLLFPLL